jgi:hypothetical protein
MKGALTPSLLLILSVLRVAQDVHKALTNSDIVNMTKSGMGTKTIILLTQQSRTNFDTSPGALIELKREGVQDEVLNAMLAAPSPKFSKTEGSSLAGGRNEVAVNPTATLRSVKTIFVDGNSESADKIRKHLESQSCFALAINRSEADAVMSVSEEN